MIVSIHLWFCDIKYNKNTKKILAINLLDKNI